ncbi:MAG: long-chain fatty acid--CoA ligase [Alphaproteobacteria bacterium]|nr:long-chain fatty acid--CoA ligase [Alphaproteobacteria bacterium]
MTGSCPDLPCADDFITCISSQDQGLIYDDIAPMSLTDCMSMVGDIKAELRKQNVRPHEPVLISVNNRAEDIAAILAIIDYGAIAVPVHEKAHQRTWQHIAQCTGSRYKFSHMKPNSRNIPKLEHQATKFPTQTDPQLANTAIITFTSGSTGQPKGVMLNRGRMSAKFQTIATHINLKKHPICIMPLQLIFSFGQWATLLPLMYGGTVYIGSKFDPQRTFGCLAEHPSAYLAAVPSMLRMMLDQGPIHKPFTILTGGEAVSATLRQQLFTQWPLMDMFSIYGLTETGTCDLFRHDKAGEASPQSLGYPAKYIEVHIEPKSHEMAIKTPFGMLGYVGEPQKTTETIVQNWIMTGDAAHFDDKGAVVLEGRLKELINRGGMKISPLEIENIFRGHPDIADILVTSVPDTVLGEAIHMLVICKMGKNLDAQSLKRWGETQMERFKVPDSIHFGEELPLGSTGKADRNLFRQHITKAQKT